ncbi:peptidylprolyl isomerase [Flavobacteriaceae bacterium]|nr:peptidylprolyl isomerase [Flavobacteriaceae bacterium]MDB4013709.1 peptidylprolyl isomerase [Flavobacteriaceae bacterium]
MAILGQIRSQSIILIIVIGLALFAFVISGVFDGKGYQAQQPVGIINGQDILIEDFRGQVDFLERNYNQKGMVAVNNVWNQRLRSEILNQQFEITGIQSGKDHLQNILKNNPTFNSDQQFLNEAGIFDIDKFKALIIELKTTNPEAYENWKNQEKIFESQSNEQIYFNLVRAGINYTQTDGKFEYNLQNDNVDIEYIQIPYSSVEDSLITYTISDLKKYIDNNKDEFKVDASRNIEYVIFEEKPSFDDENAIKNRLNSFLKESKVYNSVSKLEEVTPSLITAKNIKEFINEYSETSFDSIYLPKGSLPADHANLLFNLNNNQTYGPYLDGDYFKISRMLDKKIGGSVRSSHILLAYKGSQNANPNVTRSKKEAKKEANNILRKIRKSPENFTELAFEFSDGPSKSRGGDIGFVQDGNMVKPFNDFIFSKRVGSTGLVETDFGFHVIKIVAKDDLVLLASITEKNVPSDETSDKVFNSATKLEMNLSKEGNLNALADKDDYILKTVNGVQILDNDFPGLKDQRRIVQWLFSETTNISDYKRFDLPKGGYLIAQVTGMVDEGVSNVQDVSYKVLPMVLKSKKANFIISKNDNSLSIEKVAEMNGVDVIKALALNQKNATITGSGLEPLVIGSSFGTSLNQTSDFIIGENGVYKLKVLNRKETGFKDDSIDANFVVSYKNQLLNSNRTSAFARVYESLKENTEVSDNRSIYY